MSALLWLLVSGAASADAPRFEGELRTLALDEAGGLQGAPTGRVFIVPPGADANVEVTDLGDGARGARMTARTPSVAMVKARMRVTSIQPGPGFWTGMNFELRARDAAGALVSPGARPWRGGSYGVAFGSVQSTCPAVEGTGASGRERHHARSCGRRASTTEGTSRARLSTSERSLRRS